MIINFDKSYWVGGVLRLSFKERIKLLFRKEIQIGTMFTLGLDNDNEPIFDNICLFQQYLKNSKPKINKN